VNQSPVIVIDDDQDDLELIVEAAKAVEVDRPIICMSSGDELMAYLENGHEAPFVVLCDVNLPRESGFDIRQKIADRKDLKYKSVPFIYWSTSGSEQQVQRAYDSLAQGFFIKPSSYEDLCHCLKVIIDYWTASRHPKSVNRSDHS
jgi:CheY-like chemotaxis protein